jgi:catechol 1,2-dioxygenase
MTDIVRSAAVQSLLDRASGLGESGGNPRLKSITRDLLQALMTIIEKHDISESEFWQAVKFLQEGAGEFGLIAPGVDCKRDSESTYIAQAPTSWRKDLTDFRR